MTNAAPRIVVFAYSDVGHACLSLLLERGANVVAVYSHRDTPGETLWFPSVADATKKAGIPLHLDADLKSENDFEVFEALAPDLILSFYYREIVPAAAIELARLGAFNMHGSLLPKYRGRAPVNWAVALGEKETGATLHVMTKMADAGEIVDQEAVPIGNDDLAIDVQGRVRDAAVLVLGRQLDALLAGTAPKRAQEHQAATKFGRRRPEDGKIDWSRPAGDVHNLVRAVSHPYPGAFTEVRGQTLKIWRTRRSAEPAAVPRAKPGAIRVQGDHAFAACGEGRWLEIVRAQVNDEPELEGAPLAKRLQTLTANPKTPSL
jgi:methionyl-tRNA formyltransferase